jgi:CRP-like cAMP-binding protein
MALKTQKTEDILRTQKVQMKPKKQLRFDPKSFLSKVGEGRTIADYHKNQVIFWQGDLADAVFYLQAGKVKLTVVSKQGKEAVIAILGPGDFFGEGCYRIRSTGIWARTLASMTFRNSSG